MLNPANGTVLDSRDISPPTPAALGDFDPVGNKYYGLNFQAFGNGNTSLVLVDLKKGTVTTLGQTVNDLHVIAFVRHLN
jgi:hypothetical protein